MPFVHLHVHSPFSFLDGASSIADLVAAAAACGMPALAITDHDNVSAAVRFHHAAIAAGIKPIIGAEVTLYPSACGGSAIDQDGGVRQPRPTGHCHLTLLAQNPQGYANLCRILTHAHLSQPRLEPATSLEILRRYSDGIIALSGCMRGEVPSLILRRRFVEAEQAARRYRDIFGRERFFLETQNLLLPGANSLNLRLAELAPRLGVGLVATNNVHHRRPADFPIHDVLTCARTLTRLDDVHPERHLNAQCYLRSEQQMRELFRDHPAAVDNAARIAEMCEPALHPGHYRFPTYPTPEGETAYDLLQRLAAQGARRRYGRIAGEVARRLRHELTVIRTLGFQDYFLAVWDLAQFARREGIRYAGRGSAADSLVAYCLDLTNVDPVARGLLFERFMSLERAAPPDIDLDFQAERRDDVTNYVIAKYGQEHVGAVATYNTFRARSAVRDLGKAMSFPLEDLDYLSKHLPYIPADAIDAAFDNVPELRDSDVPRERYRKLMEICKAVAAFPRYLSTHLGGIVITGQPVMDLSPLQMAAKGVPVMHFDRDDVEDLGLIKLDLLCLRMLSAVEQSVRSIRAREPDFDYDAIPHDDRAAYDTVVSDSVGVFQLESAAQRALHARLKPDRFEDLVAAVALIRPGPILANMVDPYLARRSGREPVTYLHPALERILGKTYGVVLFQEQVIEIATTIAGFTPGEADKLRRAMTHQRSWQDMERISEHFIRRARERGVADDVARQIFSCIHAYAGYGFCEAHAAAFADTAYKTAYLKAHYPAQFYAALLSCQPMGFWPPNTLVWEAKRKGIPILGPDINRSQDRFTVEGGAGDVAPNETRTHNAGEEECGAPMHNAIRVGLAQIRGMGEASLKAIIAARKAGPFRSLEDFCRRVNAGRPAASGARLAGARHAVPLPDRRVNIDRDLIRDMILCGAFDSLCSNRRQVLWQLDAAVSDAAAPPGTEYAAPLQLARAEHAPSTLPDFSSRERWGHEFGILGIALREHPVQLMRDDLRRRGIVTAAEASKARRGKWVKVAGLVVMAHRPPTKSGRTVVFFSLEDETGMIDVTVFASVYQRCGKAIFTQPIVAVAGRLDRRDEDRTSQSRRLGDTRRQARLNPPSDRADASSRASLVAETVSACPSP
jgi:error-prone DNA polymerase